MTIQVTGKNLDVGETLRGYVQEGMQRRNQERIRRMKEVLAEPATGHGGDVVELLRQERQERLDKLGAPHR